MKTLLLAAAAAVALSTSAMAADYIIDVSYTGTVSVNDLGTNIPGLNDGTPVTGTFVFDATTNMVLSSSLDGNTVTGADNSGIVQARTDAFFNFGTYSNGTTAGNDNISIDLSSLTQFPAGSTLASVLNTQSGNTDFNGAASTGFPSTATYLNTNASGAGSTLAVYLTSVTVPEPASLVLLGTAIVGTLAAARRRS